MALLTLMSATLLSPAQVCAQVAEPTTTNDTKADNWTKITPEEYIYKWRDIAIDNMEVYGIPASITMGQAILESGYGNGYLARVANNHFCIKCKGDWTGRTITHSDDNPNDCFRAYDSAEDSFRDHAEFLNNGSRYDFLFGYDADDYKNCAKGLKKVAFYTVCRKNARTYLCKIAAVVTVIVSNDNTVLLTAHALHVLGIALSCLGNGVLVDPVSACSDNASHTARAKFDFLVEAVVQLLGREST